MSGQRGWELKSKSDHMPVQLIRACAYFTIADRCIDHFSGQYQDMAASGIGRALMRREQSGRLGNGRFAGPFRCALFRQPDAEFCPFSRFTLDGDIAVVFLNNIV